VNVVVKNAAATGTVTVLMVNIIRGAWREFVLVFSYIGYVTSEVAVGTPKRYRSNPGRRAHMFDELVVVGYGVQKKVP
jgi:hypothetical protein